MRGVARITDADGGLVLPVRDPYDREVLLDALCHRLRRSSRLRLDLDGRQWTLTSSTPTGSAACLHCQRPGAAYGVRSAPLAGTICRSCLAVVLAAAAAPPLPAAVPDWSDDAELGAAAGADYPSADASRRRNRSQESLAWPPFSK